VTPEPFGAPSSSGRPFGADPVGLLRKAWSSRAFGFRADRRVRHSHFRSGEPTGHHCRREKPRTGPGGKPQESWLSREWRPTSSFGNALECRASLLPEKGRRKHMREGGGKPSPRRRGKSSGEERYPREHRPSRASVRTGTDPRREQSPGAAGHHDLLVLRAGERDVRNGMRASAPQGVLLCAGEKL
jgi:hypothetical protein